MVGKFCRVIRDTSNEVTFTLSEKERTNCPVFMFRQ